MIRMRILPALVFAASLSSLYPLNAQEISKEYQEVLTLLGKSGDFSANVLKANIPRSDLSVQVAGHPTPTPFGFGGWLAFTRATDGMDVMMGDLVLTQDELNPVLSALLENGIEVTAIHNHFLNEEPRLFYMHVHGHGKAAELAKAARPALDLIGKNATPPAANPAAAAKPDVDTEALAKIVGRKGDTMGSVFKFTVGRDDLHVTEMGAVINARMGLNSWAAFAGTQADAQIAGDIAMKESEVTAVLKALRAHNLNVTAIHHHMLGTQPTIIFLHYWGRGPADKLAEGFRATLDVLGH
jgi:Domain of Unknown Function (DUF1259)